MVYRDSPLRGDALSRRPAGGPPRGAAGRRLRRAAGQLGARRRRAVAPAGAVHGAAGPASRPTSRASTRSPGPRPTTRAIPRASSAAVERWTAEYRELGIEAITAAMVVLRAGSFRRPCGDDHPRPAGGPRAAAAAGCSRPTSDSMTCEPGSRVEPRARAGDRARASAARSSTRRRRSVRFEVTAAVADRGGRAARTRPTPRCGGR